MYTDCNCVESSNIMNKKLCVPDNNIVSFNYNYTTPLYDNLVENLSFLDIRPLSVLSSELTLSSYQPSYPWLRRVFLGHSPHCGNQLVALYYSYINLEAGVFQWNCLGTFDNLYLLCQTYLYLLQIEVPTQRYFSFS